MAAAIVPLTNCSKEPVVVLPPLHVGWGQYDSRAIVIALPADGNDLVLKHEAIPTFMSIEGECDGMQAMQMPFPLGEGVSLEGLNVDDIVTFSFEVDWDPGFFITSISVLPEETELDFSYVEPATIYITGPSGP